MNGADALIKTFADCGVDACFANPGTSEMHLVTALDREPRIRSALCLFEGVATGAADGYARIAQKPAMTLLHLGPGYLNGGANLHDARRAFSPTINVIGDHATYHRHLDAPLTSDIETLVKPLSAWTDVVRTPGEAGAKAAAAYAASFGPPGGNAFLILPADSAWSEGGAMGRKPPTPSTKTPDAVLVEEIARSIKAAKKPAVLVNGDALSEAGLSHLARLDAAGVFVLSDTFSVMQRRGAGMYAPTRLPYFGEQALETLAGVDLLVTIGTKHPVAFFAYPGKPSELTPEGAARLSLGGPEINSAVAVEMLAEALGAPRAAPRNAATAPDAPTGALTPEAAGFSLARHMPEGAIVADDSVTAGLSILFPTMQAAPHDWLFHTGGAIGQGMPMAVGAAVAARDRKVIALCGDGAAMYTVQALWTMAREKLDITVVIFANRIYRILLIELARTGAGNPGPTAQAMLSLGDPALDWVKMAQAQGVDAARCETAEDFDRTLARMLAQKGPTLIEAVV
ncbi:MAG: acetolactate synthase large subunit [Hydrogenophilaceae bacterium]|jgi:acetolactate synthase-1/2/3 large subunit|nr:acetolactate synthase large subunit [Hydrogenophilaceae bacterium]